MKKSIIMKKLKKGHIYQIAGRISVFRGYQGGAYIFTSLNKAAKERYLHYQSPHPQYPLKKPGNWGRSAWVDMEEVSFWPSLYWKLKLLLTWKR